MLLLILFLPSIARTARMHIRVFFVSLAALLGESRRNKTRRHYMTIGRSIAIAITVAITVLITITFTFTITIPVPITVTISITVVAFRTACIINRHFHAVAVTIVSIT